MKLSNTSRGCCGSNGGCSSSCGKLNTFDYLSSLPQGCSVEDYGDGQFKNTRKGFYLNNLHIPLFKGDMVAVEASPGHDIGVVTLTGKMVELQMRRCNYHIPADAEPKKIYRIAKQGDIDKYEEAKALEHDTMIQSRQIANSLGLDMKIGDVEYQGDGQKAIFYYIADQRVDFRQLIKKLAEAFHIRIEMKQIGARQEAGRIGGLGPCGRQLCCSGWISSFVSVGTNSARIQDLSLNPQKLAGQCAKLKCCLNYEVDTYYEAQHKLPSREIELRTEQGNYRLFKTDILSGMMTYIPAGPRASLDDAQTVHSSRVFDVIRQNKAGKVPFSLLHDHEDEVQPQKSKSKDILSDESLTRFDAPKEDRQKRKKKRNGGDNRTFSSPESGSSDRPSCRADQQDRNERTRQPRPQDRRPRRDRVSQKPTDDMLQGDSHLHRNGDAAGSDVIERVKANAEAGSQRRRKSRKKPHFSPKGEEHGQQTHSGDE